MEITVVINDEMLDGPIREAVSRAVNELVKRKSNELISKYHDKIENAIDIYLSKKLTDDKIKSMIDSQVVEHLSNRILDLEEIINE